MEGDTSFKTGTINNCVIKQFVILNLNQQKI